MSFEEWMRILAEHETRSYNGVAMPASTAILPVSFIRRGDETLLVIDKALLASLQIDENTPVNIYTDGQRIIVEPIDPGRAEQLRAAVEEADREYAQMFKRLAE